MLEFLLPLADAAHAAPTSGNLWGTLLLLIGLELVLGVDNILMISILASRLPEEQRKKATLLGLSLALVVRIGLLFGVSALLALSDPLKGMVPALAGPATSWFSWLSPKDLILVVGGAFLIYKAVKEIHHVVEFREDSHAVQAKGNAFGAVIAQIVILDMVFSIDSVITAVGMLPDPSHLWYIITAVIVSFGIVMGFAKPIGDFILRQPALKILALAFLVTIGVTIIMEGFGHHVEKAFIYLPMGFALGIELLQMRYAKNRLRRGDGAAH